MTNDENLDAARKLLDKYGCQWINTDAASVKELVEKRFRITAYPTMVLLSPDGKIVSAGQEGQPGLRGPSLEETLASILKP